MMGPAANFLGLSMSRKQSIFYLIMDLPGWPCTQQVWCCLSDLNHSWFTPFCPLYAAEFRDEHK